MMSPSAVAVSNATKGMDVTPVSSTSPPAIAKSGAPFVIAKNFVIDKN